jgi:hypothetical protein
MSLFVGCFESLPFDLSARLIESIDRVISLGLPCRRPLGRRLSFNKGT